MSSLFIPNKDQGGQNGPISQPGYGTDMRAIERWANSLEIATGASSDFFNIENYGAVPGAADVTSSVTAAMTAANGGTVFFPKGQWFVDPITVSIPGTTFYLAAGAIVTCNTAPATGAPFIYVTAAECSFIGQGANSIFVGHVSVSGINDAIFFAAGADYGKVSNCLIEGTNRGVRSWANYTAVLDNEFATCANSSVVIGGAGTGAFSGFPPSITGGLVRGNHILLPSNVISSQPTGINIQNPQAYSGFGTPSNVDNTFQVTSGYTVTGAEVGDSIRIINGGPGLAYSGGSVASYQMAPNLEAIVTGANVGTNTLTLSIPGFFGPAAGVSGIPFRLAHTTLQGVIVESNRIEFTSQTDNALAIQNFETINCVFKNNVILAQTGYLLGANQGSGMGISDAGYGWNIVEGNYIRMNGKGPCIESDSSYGLYKGNITIQQGTGGVFHCTNKFASDQVIEGNVLEAQSNPIVISCAMNGTTTLTDPSSSGIFNTNGIQAGMQVRGHAVPAHTFVTSVAGSGNSCVISSPTSDAGTFNLTFQGTIRGVLLNFDGPQSSPIGNGAYNVTIKDNVFRAHAYWYDNQNSACIVVANHSYLIEGNTFDCGYLGQSNGRNWGCWTIWAQNTQINSHNLKIINNKTSSFAPSLFHYSLFSGGVQFPISDVLIDNNTVDASCSVTPTSPVTDPQTNIGLTMAGAQNNFFRSSDGVVNWQTLS